MCDLEAEDVIRALGGKAHYIAVEDMSREEFMEHMKTPHTHDTCVGLQCHDHSIYDLYISTRTKYPRTEDHIKDIMWYAEFIHMNRHKTHECDHIHV